MFMPLFRDWSIRAKLISVTLFLVLLPLLCVAYLSMNRFGKALRSASEEDLDHLVRNIYSMCKVQQEMVQMKVVSDLNVARELLYLHDRAIEIVPGEKLHFDAVNQFTQERFQVTVPLWKIGDKPLSRDTHFVDEVQKLVGGTCTIFQRFDGNRLLRISTNVIEKNGKRAVGTFIPPDSPVAQAILSGRSYSGRAYVVNDWYITAYEPIKGDNGKVIGALYVGVREQSAQSFKDEIKKIKVGDTGYVFVMDGKGTLKAHPAKEGECIIDSRDSSGFEYIRSMVNDAIALEEGDVGTIRYPWINPELGETKSRQKINKYIYFEPWNWIIVAGTYEEEIYSSLYETERFIIIVGLMGLVLVLVLTLTLSTVLTRPIKELTEVTTRMAGGDLSERVLVRSADEIGVLGVSFNRMIVQVQHYTSNLEKIVSSRTKELEESREKYRDISRFLNSILDSATEYAIMALDFYGKFTSLIRERRRFLDGKRRRFLIKKNQASPSSLRIAKDLFRRRCQNGQGQKVSANWICIGSGKTVTAFLPTRRLRPLRIPRAKPQVLWRSFGTSPKEKASRKNSGRPKSSSKISWRVLLMAS